MPDQAVDSARSALMGRIRGKNTGPELKLRRALWKAGLRYRLEGTVRLPGRPDLLFLCAKLAIFVDGCFWHGCPEHGTQPKTRPEFWAAKIARNRARDAEVDVALVAMGWRVVRVWEHELRDDLDGCVARISAAVRLT